MGDENLLKLILLEEEEEDEERILFLHVLQKRHDIQNMFLKRTAEGYFKLLIHHLKKDEMKFREFFRLNLDQFHFVLSLIQDYLTKPGTNAVPFPITAEEKLALTLRFMATGETFRSLAFAFRISHSYISTLVKQTLSTMCKYLVPIFIPAPSKELHKRNAEEFWKRWNFPNCVGALDGKHIRIFSPSKSGSLYFNYKDYFSIVMLALVDANYKFIVLDVGSYGKKGDSSIFNKSALGRKILNSEDFFPIDQVLPTSNKKMPYVIVGDGAFRLHKCIMKPFNKLSANSDKRKAVFNYRLSRARRVSENAFGLLCQVFRVFYTHIALKPEVCDDLIIAACCLHNLLREAYLEKNQRPHYEYDSSENTSSINYFQNFSRPGGFQNVDGFQIREIFLNFFNQEGALDWQERHISKVK